MTTTAHPSPRYRIVVGEMDITTKVEPRLINLTLTDNRGMEADQLDIAIDDHDGEMAIPPHGAVLKVWLGWNTTGLVYKGSFSVDETVHSGAPDTLTIRARSAVLSAGLAKKKERSWHRTTLGDIARKIAGEHSLTPRVAEPLDAIEIRHIDQGNESDLNLLTRLAEQHDFIATIKSGNLLLMPAGAGKTVSGAALHHVVLTRADGDSHSYQVADRDSYTGVIAQYHRTAEAKTLESKVGEESNAKRLRHVYPDRAAAEKAAQAEWDRIQRGKATLTYTFARGRPELIPECTFVVVY